MVVVEKTLPKGLYGGSWDTGRGGRVVTGEGLRRIERGVSL